MLADRWQCSDETVRQMVHRGELRAFRVGRMIRIPWDAVEELECQTSLSDGYAADSASTGRTKPESGGAINLRHARERKRKQRAATDT
ncbi:excisionase family DNA-binding protein [Roseovarius indicus]|uniref:excisionase family DNA-binding protein n=1 Tax=Roseovarius indicus TaxID=540747 RepID=UPI0032ED15B6